MSPTEYKSVIIPLLSVRGGARAVDFYKKAFDAKELLRLEAENGDVFAQLSAGGSEFWVSDESPQHLNFSPESLGGSSARMVIVVEDPDSSFARAVAAGAKPVQPPSNMHGWRAGRVADPFGHHWEIGKPLPKKS
jgi:PhnB protein